MNDLEDMPEPKTREERQRDCLHQYEPKVVDMMGYPNDRTILLRCHLCGHTRS